MLRRAAVKVAQRSWVRKFAMSTPVLRELAWRFVAGDDLAAGIDAVRALNVRGIKGSLNFLGMHARDRAEATTATEQAIESLRSIRAEGIDSHVSIKLTKIGLDVDAALCRANLVRILEAAAESATFVRIDMEEATYVEHTLALFDEMEGRFGAATVGIVLQSYLRDRPDDVARLAERGSSIRLVKGGYLERPDVVLRERSEVDAAFRRDIKTLLRRGRHPAIATHDSEAIAWARSVERTIGLDPGAFEFQMLYGVRPDLQASLVREGYALRCYVPYGGHWPGYVIGCLRRMPGGAARSVARRFRRGNAAA